jgi:hypothetical protein
MNASFTGGLYSLITEIFFLKSVSLRSSEVEHVMMKEIGSLRFLLSAMNPVKNEFDPLSEHIIASTSSNITTFGFFEKNDSIVRCVIKFSTIFCIAFESSASLDLTHNMSKDFPCNSKSHSTDLPQPDGPNIMKAKGTEETISFADRMDDLLPTN